APAPFWDAYMKLYLLTPALVNVALNYKICVEQGLPLHPTYYFEVSEKSRFQAHYPPLMVDHANRVFLDSIAAARAVYALGDDALAALKRFRKGLPEILRGFVYANAKDKYTWRASNPKWIQSLADSVTASFRPAAVVGAAHGSILSGLVFAELVAAPLYFVRFSMFKRNDQDPILAESDRAHLAAFREGPVLLFDEDVAKGTTLTRFEEVMKPLFREAHTGSVLRHVLSPCRPEFTGHAWSD
ncbi:MAG: hypothetical protein HGA66_13460, partial [Holophaga sp.]|nr:hypothetical protein [Holophaga sp.]